MGSRGNVNIHSETIFAQYITLKEILDRHKETIQKRWTQKSRQQRLQILLKAWPGCLQRALWTTKPSAQNTRTREAPNKVPKPFRSRYHKDSSAPEQARLRMPLMLRCASSRRYTPSYTKPLFSCSQLGVDRKTAPKRIAPRHTAISNIPSYLSMNAQVSSGPIRAAEEL